MVGLVGSAQARAGDATAVDAGDTWSGLMDRAARHLARGVVEAAGRRAGVPVLLVVGKGNNGGDGWGAARRLREMGAACTVASVPPLDAELSAEAAAHRDAWIASGGHTVVGVDDVDRLLARPAAEPVIVDCLLGTGTSGAPRGEVGRACAAINRARQAGAIVVACDVPSGVSADTGQAPGDAVRADLTVTMGAMKRGLLLHPGARHAGRVVVGSLGPRYDPPARDDDGHRWTAMTAGTAIGEPLEAAADKRDRGTVLVVAGSVGTAGAAILTTRGALWAGAGLTTLATPAHIQRVVAPVIPSAMTRPLRHAHEHVAADAVDQLADADRFDTVVAGPGLGPVPGTREVVDHLLGTARRLVLDADAINVYRDDPEALADHGGTLVLTPHARELARMGGGTDGEDAWAHRVERLPHLAADLGATIVAKGPGTVVASPDGTCRLIPLGGPELGTGGTGDVLAGMIAATVAGASEGQVDDAVARAVFWHAFTGTWLAVGRPSADALVRRFEEGGVSNLRSNRVAAPTTAGFGPSSVLPEALPDALRVLAELADRRPRWPLGVPW